MSIRDDGGPAFPRPVSEDTTQGTQLEGNRTVSKQDGMSLRDWFAGQALVGLLAFTNGSGSCDQLSPEQAAEEAYMTANAMLAERVKDGGQS